MLVVHHDRKGGGEDGEGARGSSAAVATVDAILDLQRRAVNEAPSSRRTLVGLSRWAGQTPEALVFERQGDGVLVALAEGDRGEVAKRALRDRVLGAFGDEELSQQEIADGLEVTRQRVGQVLADLLRTGAVVKIESARKNIADRYRRNGPVENPVENPSQPPFNEPLSAVSSPSPLGGDDNGDAPSQHSVAPPFQRASEDDWRDDLPDGFDDDGGAS